MDKVRRATILSVYMLCIVWYATAQSDIVSSQYFSTPMQYNAGATGNFRNLLNINARGMAYKADNGNVQEASISADMPFSLSGKQQIGAGVVVDVNNERTERTWSMRIPVAWKICIGGSTLSMGLAPSISDLYSRKETTVTDNIVYTTGDETDAPETHTYKLRRTAFDVGAGMWLASDVVWGGISTVNLIHQRVNNDNGTWSCNKRIYYFMAGGNIVINKTLWQIEPSAIADLVSGRLNGQATLRAIAKRGLWVGAGYRLRRSAVAMFGLDYKGFHAGYSYVFPYRVNRAIHEITAGYRLSIDTDKKRGHSHKSVRLM